MCVKFGYGYAQADSITRRVANRRAFPSGSARLLAVSPDADLRLRLITAPGIPKGYMLLMLDYEDAIDQTAETALLTARVRSFERYAKDYATVLADEGSVRFRRFVRGKSPSDKAMVFGSLDAVVILDWLDADGRMRSGVNADWWLYHTSALADADTDLYQSYIGREVGSIRIQRDGESVLVRVDALKPIMERCEQIARMLAPQQALTPDQRTEWRSKAAEGASPLTTTRA